MEDLVTKLSVEFSVSTPMASTAPPRLDYLRRRPDHQAKRRRDFLQRQAQKRFDKLQHVRNLAKGDFSQVESEKPTESMDSAEAKIEEEEEEEETSMLPDRSFKNQLMLSEWLIDIPDLNQFLVAVCPQGRRALLVASQGLTKLYARSGHMFLSFPSNIPGGSIKSRKQPCWKPNDFTILDVVYNDESKTCFILDMIAWRSQCYYDSETVFRFYWLRTQFQENLEEIESTRRKIKFEIVPSFEWNAERLTRTVTQETPPFEAEIDGILFYHKNGHYIPGICPLVGWLKPYMLPDIGVPIHPRLMKNIPEDYISSVREKPYAPKKVSSSCKQRMETE